MTRKDYKLLARAIWGSAFVSDPIHAPVGERIYAQKQWLTTVRHIADALANDNPRFDRAKFELACGRGEE